MQGKSDSEIREIFACGIRNTAGLKESGIPRTSWIPIQNSPELLDSRAFFCCYPATFMLFYRMSRKSLPNLVYLAKGFQPIRNEGFFFSMDDHDKYFFCFAAIEQTTCIQCFEVKDFGLFCKNTFSKVPCPSQNQCYTAKGHAKIFLRPDQFITTTVEGRGCANCKGKKVSATLIRPQPHPEKTMG